MPTLHPQIVKAIEAMDRAGLKPIEAMSPVEARQQMEATGFVDMRIEAAKVAVKEAEGRCLARKG